MVIVVTLESQKSHKCILFGSESNFLNVIQAIIFEKKNKHKKGIHLELNFKICIKYSFRF